MYVVQMVDLGGGVYDDTGTTRFGVMIMGVYSMVQREPVTQTVDAIRSENLEVLDPATYQI